MRPDASYGIHPDVAAEPVGEELLLVQLAQGTTFCLNSTGRTIWELLAAGSTVAEVTDELHGRLGVDSERFAADTHKLVTALLESGLLLSRSRETP